MNTTSQWLTIRLRVRKPRTFSVQHNVQVNLYTTHTFYIIRITTARRTLWSITLPPSLPERFYFSNGRDTVVVRFLPYNNNNISSKIFRRRRWSLIDCYNYCHAIYGCLIYELYIYIYIYVLVYCMPLRFYFYGLYRTRKNPITRCVWLHETRQTRSEKQSSSNRSRANRIISLPVIRTREKSIFVKQTTIVRFSRCRTLVEEKSQSIVGNLSRVCSFVRHNEYRRYNMYL